ncbi:hypothetical protein DFS34DRAFT_426069 [Phlyctochytrium arcticum]|nr:hypothetical protein DFS34DRAFT_426069 [Phlyctochytrium arcticum]
MSTVVDDIDASESGSRHENSFARAESGAFFNITNAVLKDARGCISYSAATGFCQNITSTTPAVSDYVMRAGALCHLTVKDLSVIGASGGTDGAVLYITQSNVDLDNLTVLRMDCYWACFRINHAYSVHFSNSVLKGNKVTEGFFRIENSAVAVDFAKPFIFSNLYFESNTGPLLLAFRIALEIHNSTFKNHPPVTGSGLDHPVLFVFADRISRMLAVNNLFTDNRGPGDGSIVRQCGGNLTFVRNTFSDNKAVGNGGAIYCDLWYGNALVVTNNTFLRNNAVNGAGVYVANMQSPTHFRITNNIFQANVAKLRGGGWYSTQQDILPVQNGNVYVDNTAKGATGGGTGISGIVVSNGGDLITTTSGVSLPDIQVKGVDLLGNKFFSDPLDPAILLYLSTGQNSTAAISGKALRMLLGDEVTFSGVAVSGGVGDHQLQIEQRTVGSQYGLAEVAIPVKIIQCLPPRYMLPTGASSEMKCRLRLRWDWILRSR